MRNLLLAAVAGFIFLTAATTHGSVSFTDFSSTSGLTLNGSGASLNNGIDTNPVLRLANATTFDGGSAFTNSTMDITSFNTTFAFRISAAAGVSDSSGQSGADGLVFVIQPNSAATLGNLGGNLGYGGKWVSTSLS